MTCFDLQEQPTRNGFPLLVYGTKSGNIGAIELTSDEAIVLWETDFAFENKAIVSHIKVASLKEGVQNICVSREDGSIEVYSFSEKMQAQIEYETRDSDEQVTGIAVGFVTSPKQPEVIYACYSGAIKSICERKMVKKIGVAVDEGGLEDAPTPAPA